MIIQMDEPLTNQVERYRRHLRQWYQLAYKAGDIGCISHAFEAENGFTVERALSVALTHASVKALDQINELENAAHRARQGESE